MRQAKCSNGSIHRHIDSQTKQAAQRNKDALAGPDAAIEPSLR